MASGLREWENNEARRVLYRKYVGRLCSFEFSEHSKVLQPYVASENNRDGTVRGWYKSRQFLMQALRDFWRRHFCFN